MADPTLLDVEEAASILEEYRLLPRELLREDIGTARKHLSALAERAPAARVVVLTPQGDIQFRGRLNDLFEGETPLRLEFRTVLLPTSIGGLDPHGRLDPAASGIIADVSSRARPAPRDGDARWSSDLDLPAASEFRDHGRLVEKDEGWEFIVLGQGETHWAPTREAVIREARRVTGLQYCVIFPLRLASEDAPRRELAYLKARPEPGSQAVSREMLLSTHLTNAGKEAEGLAGKLGLPEGIVARLAEAARGHDLGKARRVWQEYARNTDPSTPKAKSESYRDPESLGGYRHELGSLVDIGREADPLVRHLIASHHGYGRPDFPDGAMDRDHLLDSCDQSELQLRQFTALQREYGWWGLAYLEALLKAADARASA